MWYEIIVDFLMFLFKMQAFCFATCISCRIIYSMRKITGRVAEFFCFVSDTALMVGVAFMIIFFMVAIPAALSV